MIYCDSQATIGAIMKNLPSTGTYLPEKIHEEAGKYKTSFPGTQIHIIWMPGHNGHYRQEEVDQLAKAMLKMKSKN